MQDYKVVIRSLVSGATVFGQDGNMVAQNFSEFMSYLNEQYLGQGYTILKAENLRVIAGDGSIPTMYEFAYHLIKDVVVTKK